MKIETEAAAEAAAEAAMVIVAAEEATVTEAADTRDEKCTTQYAQHAAQKQKCHSSQAVTDQSIAETAI